MLVDDGNNSDLFHKISHMHWFTRHSSIKIMSKRVGELDKQSIDT